MRRSSVPGVGAVWARLASAGVAVRQRVRQARRARAAQGRSRGKRLPFLMTALAVWAGLLFWAISYLSPDPVGQRLTISQLETLANQHRVVAAAFRDEDAQIVGRFSCAVPAVTTPAATAPATSGKSAATSTNRSGNAGAGSTGTAGAVTPPPRPVTCEGPRRPGASAPKTAVFLVSYPKSDSVTSFLVQLLSDSGASVGVDHQAQKTAVRMLSTVVLPLVILANLFALLVTGGKGGGAGIGDVELFGSIGKGRFGRRRKQPITFADVAGADEAMEELKEVRDYLANPQRYRDIGALPPKGVLLIGPPGCGKTLLAKAVAGEVGVPFFSVAGAEFVESLVGVGAARVRDLFRRVRAAAPAILFIDELDAAGRRRAAGGGSGGSDEREQTLNQMLVEMDGFDVASGIVVMAATNRPDILDPALLRPGRFDRHVTVDRPDLLGRIRILELHTRGKPLSPDVDLAQVARRTPGFSGADLANVINEAALLSVRLDKTEIEASELEEAVHRVMSGTVRRGATLNAAERKRVAHHEAGHVVVAAATGDLDDLHRVSILGRGRTLGSTSRADNEVNVLTRTQLTDRLVALLAGMAAEELVFGEPSTGAEQDVAEATELALDIVARYGMNPRLGPVRLLARDTDEFLDADVPLAAVSGQTHHEIDGEVRRLLDDARKRAMSLLGTHRAALETIATRLEVEETLEGRELEELLTSVRPEVELFGSLNGDAKKRPVVAQVGSES